MVQPEIPRRIFYGWYIVLASVTIYFLNVGTTYSTPPVFFPQLIKEFGSTEAAITRTLAIQLTVAGLLSPLIGAQIDRFGVQRLMRIGVGLLAITLALYPFTNAVWQLYVLHTVFAICQPICGLIIHVVLLSAWFVKRRGAMIGLVVAGSSMAGAIMPNIVAPIIDSPDWGWRWAFGLLATIFWLVAIPLAFVVIKNRPRDVGQYPDGDPGPPPDHTGPRKDPTVLPGLTFRQALRTGPLWFLAIGSGLILFAIVAVQSQIFIYLNQDLDLTAQLAAFYLSLTWMFSIAGKFSFAYLSDRFQKRYIMMLTTALLFVGSLLLLRLDSTGESLSIGLVQSRALIVIFSVFFGLGFGGTFSMIQLMVAECFGPREMGRILGFVTMVDNLSASAGIVVAGFLRTATGSYVIPFSLVLLSSFIGLINVWLVRPVPFGKHLEPSTD